MLALVGRYTAETGRAESTTGRLTVGDGRFFRRVRDGHTSFTVATYDRVVTWFSENWPEDAPWPDDVPRPVLLQPEGAVQ